MLASSIGFLFVTQMMTACKNITTLESFTEGIYQKVYRLSFRIPLIGIQVWRIFVKFLGVHLGFCQLIHFLPIVLWWMDQSTYFDSKRDGLIFMNIFVRKDNLLSIHHDWVFRQYCAIIDEWKNKKIDRSNSLHFGGLDVVQLLSKIIGLFFNVDLWIMRGGLILIHFWYVCFNIGNFIEYKLSARLLKI